MKVLAAALAVAASVVLAPTAQADVHGFYQCNRNVGVASLVTSCAFAQNVAYRYPYTSVQWGVTLHDVYSPATGLYYDMYCNPGTITFGLSGYTINAEVCEGGNDARVAVIG